jgi:hypothetical protein
VSHQSAEEVPLAGGWVTEGVMRLDDTVRRPAGATSGFVVELLGHLERAGFVGVPRFLGYDEQGRETLSFLPGEVPPDCRSVIWKDNQISGSMRLLRRFHDHTAGSALAGAEEVVCHNDFGPWNLVWRDGFPEGIIDFDRAAPGPRLADLAFAAWKFLNLGSVDLPISEQQRRLRLLARSYGIEPDAQLLAGIRTAQARMRALIESGAPGHRRFMATAQITLEQQWLEAHGAGLIE